MITTEIPAGIEATNRLFEALVAEGKLSDLSAIYTEGARILPPGAPMVTGLPEIAAFWQAAGAALQVKTLTLKTVELDLFEDHAIEIGHAAIHTAASPTPLPVKYVVNWKLTAEGWRWDIDIWNPEN